MYEAERCRSRWFRGSDTEAQTSPRPFPTASRQVIWRAANQSVFAEAIELLSEFGLTREEFHTGVAARKCSYTLDLDEAALEAQAELVVSVAAGGEIHEVTRSRALGAAAKRVGSVRAGDAELGVVL
eukprot:scaffold2085_cov263-Pinguiococcus_pyrenoidosus.AAC.11